MTARAFWPCTATDPVSMGSIRAAARVDRSPYIRGLAFKLDAMDAQRIRCIGEGRAKAAARMRRFVAWLRGLGLDGSARRAGAYMSPEHFAMREPGFVAQAVGPCWERRWLWSGGTLAMAREMLASPEWASLPWQVEP